MDTEDDKMIDGYNYIQYHDGTEELYDRERDPNEWTNLAGDPEYSDIVRKLKKIFQLKVPGTDLCQMAVPGLYPGIRHLVTSTDLTLILWIGEF